MVNFSESDSQSPSLPAISTSPPSASANNFDLTSSPTSTTASTISVASTETERPPRSASPTPTREIPMPGPSKSGDSTSKAKASRPSLLCPPATIISPPSPVEQSTGLLPPQPSISTPTSAEEEQQPDQGWSTPPPKSATRGQSHPADPEGSPRPIAATSLSLPPRFISPASQHSPLPTSPGPGTGTGTSSENLTFPGNRRDSLAVPSTSNPPATTSDDEPLYSNSPFSSPGLGGHGQGHGHGHGQGGFGMGFPPAPSSPHAYPKRIGHRRESSTHRVKETPNGLQRSTEDGEVMVNQYRIGKGLGKGGFAKVELAVDVGTGKEYAIKEFSQSRLHTQSLQEKQRLASRGRMRRGRGRGGRPAPERRCSLTASEGEDDDEDADVETVGKVKIVGKGKVRRARAISEPDEGDPLGLIRREIAVMKKLDHPNIVLLYEAISVPNADALFLVLEYLSGGVLLSVHLGGGPTEPPFSVDQSREYFRQLILGLEYLHANGVVHRDIKPDNILLSEDRTVVKLCDFGVSEMFIVEDADDRIKKSGGSPAFLSPESFTSHTHEVHGKLVDIWALGVTLYCMFTGSLPFNTENPIELFEMVQNDEPTIPDALQEDQKDLIRQMLRKEPSFRIHLFMIREHPWVTEDGANPMISRDDNLYHVGKFVDEPTQEELSSAIGALRGVFTVIRAVQKMRRLGLARRSLNSSPQPSPPVRNSTLDSVMSGTTGSMDSYVSDLPTDTDNTSMEGVGDNKAAENGEEEDAHVKVDSPGLQADREDGEVQPLKLDEGKLKLPARGERPSSPKQLLGEEAPYGESKQTAEEHMGGLRISTGVNSDQSGRGGKGDGSMVDSPMGEREDTPQQSQMEDKGDEGEVQMMDSPVEDGDDVQIMDSPVGDDDAPAPPGGDDGGVQLFESPVDEEDVMAAIRKLKGRPRPRPRP